MKRRLIGFLCALMMLCVTLMGSSAESLSEQTASPAPGEADAADTWDLTEYFADDAAFEKELNLLKKTELPKYKEMAGAVTDADTLFAFKQYSDAIAVRIRRLSCYAEQKGSLNASDASAQTLGNAATLLSQDFSLVDTAYTNRLLAMDEAFWTAVFADKRLSPYLRELTKMREDAAHTLTDAEESLLMPAYQAEGNINNTATILDYSSIVWPTVTDPQGNEVEASYTNYIPTMTHPDRAYRKVFYESFVKTYGKFRDTFASNLNAYTTLTEQLSVLHHYDSLLDSQMRANGLTVEMYDALIAAARNSTNVLTREAEIRKKALGFNELYAYDSRLPLGESKAPRFTYAEAQQLIKEALSPLGSEYTDVLDMAYQNRWIDAYPGENKDTGAYSGMAVDIHPWVMTNFVGNYGSVSMLAHELGHAVHQYRSYAARESEYERNPSNLVSEVASTFNELLLSRYMIEHAKDDAEKLYYVQQELSMLKDTFFGQIAFADFERQFHKLAEGGEALTADALDALYMENLGIYSPGYTILDASASYWAAIPHFYYNYYVYSYAMAVSVSCVAADAVASGDAKMLENYLAFLSAGDSADSAELFKGLGVDVTSTGYTKPLMERYAELLDLEEQLLGLK